MPLIDYGYFADGRLKIAGMDKLAIQQAVTVAIADYETEYLQKLLGPVMYAEFIAQVNRELPLTPDAIWVDLWKGYLWTDSSGSPRKWPGFVNDAKTSPIACYVYFHYVRNNVTQTTAVGEVVSKSENAEVVSPTAKLVRAWNRMVELNNELLDYLTFRKDMYADWWKPYSYPARGGELFQTINSFGI